MKIAYIFQSTKPFYHSDLNPTLEEITLKTKKKGKSGLLENLITDKTKSLKATVKALLSEINNREKLNRYLLNSLEEDICRLNSGILNLKNINTYYQFDKFLDVDKIKQKTEKNVLTLESEKRKEHIECWKDLMFLKKYLMSALKEYWDAVKRRELLRRE